MKLLGQKTPITVGDIAILNPTKNTLEIKRGKEILHFDRLIIDNEKVSDIGHSETSGICLGCRGTDLPIKDLLKIILSVTSLTAVKVIGSGKANEEYWQIQRHSENAV